MHHVGIAFDDERLVHIDRANLGDTPNVITAKVQKHEMFGALFFVGQKLFSQRIIFANGFATFACTGDRADGHFVIAHADKDFRAGADKLKVAE